jgi:hypothetical protein
MMAETHSTVLDTLEKQADAGTWQSLAEVWDAYGAERAAGRTPFAAAVHVAARADRLGHAFAVGYPAALQQMVPDIGLPCALCVTEAEGNSPRAIASRLGVENGTRRLSGVKTFVTFGTLAKTLLVAARTGLDANGRPDLVVVKIPAGRSGITLHELPPIPFVPEVPHAQVTFDGVVVDEAEQLPGDGYLDYVKPFRTIEDIHVIGATVGYVLGWSLRVRAALEPIAGLIGSLLALEALAKEPPLSPAAHVALHGCYRGVTEIFSSDAFRGLLASSSEAERERWMRDRRLLSVASEAREARLSAALRALGYAASAPSSTGE